MIFKDIVVGSSIDALMYAFVHSYPIVLVEGREPFDCENLNPEESFDLIKFPNHTEVWNIEDRSTMVVGNSVKELYSHLLYIHSLSGLVICQNGATPKIEIFSDSKKIEVYTDQGVLQYFPQSIHLFQLENILGIDINEQKNKTIIHDWFYVDSGKNHDIHIAHPDFGTLFFHTTDRGRNPQYKDVLLQKIVETGRQDDEENMIYVHKLDIESYMTNQLNIQGVVHSKTYTYPINIQPKERELTKRIEGNPILPDHCKFVSKNYYDTYTENSEAIRGYTKKILDRL